MTAAARGLEPSDAAATRATRPDRSTVAAPAGRVPPWWAGACLELRESDPRFVPLIDQCPPLRAGARGDAFATLARSIVGQQVSVKAAQSVWERLTGVCGRPSPATLARVSIAELRACGLSTRKAEYIGGLARHFLERPASAPEWSRMDDAAIVAELVSVRGIGVWTAQMFLIFHLARPDVLPLADLGLRRAIALRYGRGRDPAQRTLARLSALWQPWRTAATWYLWRSLDPEPVRH
jgi:DNA-3-methyladenine glycosylase II